MIHVYGPRGAALERRQAVPDGALRTDAVWIDVIQPDAEEEKRLEAALGVDIPTLEEMQEIETSSRLYEENGALYMTASIVWRADSPEPRNTVVTFIVTRDLLVTVRYADPQPFKTFAARCSKQPQALSGSGEAFIALLDTVIDRIADVLERIAADLDLLSAEIFRTPTAGSRVRFARRRPGADLQSVIRRIGQRSDLAGKLRESLLTLGRIIPYFRAHSAGWLSEDLQNRLRSLDVDVQALAEHDGFLALKINFLLDATLGFISNQQAGIIKIFSVVAVVFMPPTLVASIYGMNFRHMPELDWLLGYPMALGLMLLSAILPYLYFKFRGWL